MTGPGDHPAGAGAPVVHGVQSFPATGEHFAVRQHGDRPLERLAGPYGTVVEAAAAAIVEAAAYRMLMESTGHHYTDAPDDLPPLPGWST